MVALGWTDQEDLVIVQEDGMVMLYKVFERQFLSQFSMGQVPPTKQKEKRKKEVRGKRKKEERKKKGRQGRREVERTVAQVDGIFFLPSFFFLVVAQAAAGAGLQQAKITPDGRGVVVLTNDNRFYSVANFADPKVSSPAHNIQSKNK